MSNVSLALYQPDMPQNTGSMMRLAACLGVSVDIIEPCGFIWDDKRLKRVAMDYIDHLTYERHASWEAFRKAREGRRQILLTTKAEVPYTDFTFQPGDILITGRESAGAPESVHNQVDAQLIIPMTGHVRSLNVALSAAMVLGEALRQVGNKA